MPTAIPTLASVSSVAERRDPFGDRVDEQLETAFPGARRLFLVQTFTVAVPREEISRDLAASQRRDDDDSIREAPTELGLQ
jgi:hypothetical protein